MKNQEATEMQELWKNGNKMEEKNKDLARKYKRVREFSS